MVGPSRREFCEDVAQDTFLDVFRVLGDFSPLGPARLSSFILCIASRRAIDRLRRDRLEPAPHADVAEMGASSDSPARNFLAQQVAGAVATLGPDQRAVLLLRDVHGLEYTEIARALRIDTGTVKSRLSRARAAVRTALTEGSHD
jgi:RNA polymerase sigma-70 factor (ECF subfamily)